MTYLTKTFSLVGIFCLTTVFALQAQIVALQYRHVPPENEAEFLHRETTYWSQVAKKAIAEGKMINWELWERVGGWDMDDESSNYVFVNVFEKATDLDDQSGIWGVTSELFPNTRMSDMETNSLSTVVSSILLQSHGQVGQTGNFAVVNYSKASDMAAFVEFETKQWQPFITNAMKMGKTSFKGWSMATLLSPRGAYLPFTGMSVDQFDKYSDAIAPHIDESLTMPDFTEYEKIREIQYVGVYRLVAKAE